MRVEIVSHSDIGRVRDHNEDSVGTDESLGLLILADGMGGPLAGEVASDIAVKTILSEMKKLPKDLTDQQPTLLLRNAVNQANRVVFSASEAELRYQGMGTTVVVAVFHEESISIAHVGDSRLYRLRGTDFVQLTTDHSVLQELIECGLYTPEQARYAPNRNLVTRAVGVGPEVNVETQAHKIEKEDIYLMCSDGLNNMLKDEEIAKILQDHRRNLLQAVYLLVKFANDKGGEDNISVILARPLFDKPRPHYLLTRLSKFFWW